MTTALLLIDIQNDYFPGGRWNCRQRRSRQAGGGAAAAFRGKACR